MHTLDIHRHDLPDLDFILLVSALCTSPLTELNVPAVLRTILFDRCWVLIHEGPPPEKWELRVLDLRSWNEVTVDAMVETIRGVLTDAGITTLAWNYTSSNP